MHPDNVVIAGDDLGVFAEMPDHDVYIVAQELADDGFGYWCALNPTLSAGYGALSWIASLLTHIEEHGFAAAMEMDGWQRRSDGDWQLWARPVEFPEL